MAKFNCENLDGQCGTSWCNCAETRRRQQGGQTADLVTVAGRRCSRSNSDMDLACLVLPTDEQEKGQFANSALVAALADMVRLIREYSDAMNKP